jgi:hypothetical protein
LRLVQAHRIPSQMAAIGEGTNALARELNVAALGMNMTV